MAALSMDLRKRILDAYDRREGTQQQVADRFCVSLGMVKKLVQQRKKTGDISPRYRFCGRKPKILKDHREKMNKLLTEKPDLPLAEIREGIELECSLVAIHLALAKMGLTFKKKRYAPASKTVKTSRKAEKSGAASINA